MDEPSCDAGMSRKQFIDETIKRAVRAGALVAGAALVDKFIVPPAYAGVSGAIPTNGGADYITFPGGATDAS